MLGGLAATVLGSPASATVLWANEQAMINSNFLRHTFIYDVGAGNAMSHEQFASPGVAAFYDRHGFDMNFVYWAPIETIDPPREHWTACRDNHGGLCRDTDIVPGSQPIADEFGSGPIRVKRWNGAFIGIACGNWNRGGDGPVPHITGVKFEDVNGDGARQAGEPGLGGWTIDLAYQGSVVATTTTAPDGSYTFALNANVLPIRSGTFTVTERQQPGWVQSRAPAPVAVSYGAAATTFGGNDFGNWRPGSISGRKFEDMNADGTGAGDPGLPGWTISAGGRSAGAAVTDADGIYRISGLAPGVYTVGEQPQAGWHQSAPGGSGTHTITIRSGDQAIGIDFGNWRPAAVQGRKFDDHNVDGLGTGEPGLPDWTVTLNDTTTTTQADGGFTFGGLRPGTYTVAELQRNGWRQTAPTGGTATITVVSGQVVTGVEIGNVCLGNLSVVAPVGVTIRVDEDHVPGILRNEPAMPRLAAGTAIIDSLLPGTYRVTLTLPAGVYTTDPDLTSLDGGFAIVKTVTVAECATTVVAPTFVHPQPGKITGGVRILVPGGFATAGFEFLHRSDAPRGTLEFNDHVRGIRVHTSDISAISVAGEHAYVFGGATIDGVTYRFRLHLVDSDEPGRNDRFDLLIANGYNAGSGQTIDHGNIQIH
ncbi:MAG TPA: SdrD B-like domain-containing protein [Pseudonocardiaceae bacterium]